MFTSEYLEKIVEKYRCENPDLNNCQLLLNQLRIADSPCPKHLTAKMLCDLLGGKLTLHVIQDMMSKAGRYNDMLSLHNYLNDEMIKYRNLAKAAKERDKAEEAEECQQKADTYREKAETAWAMLQMSGATLTQVKLGEQYIWVVDIDRVF